MPKKQSKDRHKDIYLGDSGLWEEVETLVAEKKKQGFTDVSPSSVIRLCIEMGLPALKRKEAAIKTVEFKDGITNVNVEKVGSTYVVSIDNLQDGQKVRIAVSSWYKNLLGKAVKLYKRTLYTRTGNKISVKNKG